MYRVTWYLHLANTTPKTFIVKHFLIHSKNSLISSKINEKYSLINSSYLNNESIIEDKSFFPSEWTRTKVIDKIIEASVNKFIDIPEGLRRVIFGKTSEGMIIKIVVDEDNKLITAFPVFEVK